jgi:hypothetical protein
MACGPPHSIELAAKSLARPSLPSQHLDPRRNVAGNRRWAPIDVTLRRNRRADPVLDGANDLDDPLARGDQGMHLVAGADLGRRLGRVAVDPDVPAFAQLGGDGPRLDQADSAQPPIDSGFVGSEVLLHGWIVADKGRLGAQPAGLGFRPRATRGPVRPARGRSTQAEPSVGSSAVPDANGRVACLERSRSRPLTDVRGLSADVSVAAGAELRRTSLT